VCVSASETRGRRKGREREDASCCAGNEGEEREKMKSGGREKKKKKERRECAGERGDGVRGGKKMIR
jgi:hypothetical protein